MLAFLTANAQAIGVVINVAMLVVWIVYLQIFATSYVRQRRSSILINRGGGRGGDALCLVTNMGGEHIYLTSLLATIETAKGKREYALSDLRHLAEGSTHDPRAAIVQGSLSCGEFFVVGRFDEIIQLLRGEDRRQNVAAEGDGDITAIELTAVAFSGTDALPVGARRRFTLSRGDDGSLDVHPETLETRQLRSRARRKALLQKLGRHL